MSRHVSTGLDVSDCVFKSGLIKYDVFLDFTASAAAISSPPFMFKYIAFQKKSKHLFYHACKTEISQYFQFTAKFLLTLFLCQCIIQASEYPQ